ncbi:Hepatoma-derived growth factor-related protein 2 [Schistosoma japonicum]|nr:Hepatoma-derived growth factor-related protein 2 [Schistosoma japonicum]
MSHSPGDKVFAKIKGFPNWPARINPLPHGVQIPKGKLPIFFYGTYQVSFVSVKNIVPYEKFKDKWGKPKPSAQFTAAMKEIEANPGIYMLGEDPRAEQFLLQFYDFKPSGGGSGGRVRQCKRHSPRKSKDSNPELLLSNNQDIIDKANHVSDDASSEISSCHSRVDSVDPVPEDSNDEETANDNTNNHYHFIDYQQVDMKRSQQLSSDSATNHLSDEKDSYQENREARRLARKMQKKAEKKAIKKAAKREAKRLAKEKRAERRARKEAKRELKRLHKMEKVRLTEQDDLTGDVQESDTKGFEVNEEGSGNHIWDDHWSPAPLSEPVRTNYEDSVDFSIDKSIPPTFGDKCTSSLLFGQPEDIDFPTHQNDNSSSHGELLLEDVKNSPNPLFEYTKSEHISGIRRSRLFSDSNGCDDEGTHLNGGTLKLEGNEVPPKKKARIELDNMCHPEKKSTSELNNYLMVENASESNEQVSLQVIKQFQTEVETESLTTSISPTSELKSEFSTKPFNKRKSVQRSRLCRKKPTAISDSSDEDDMGSEKDAVNLHCLSSSDSDTENSKVVKHITESISPNFEEKCQNSSKLTINKQSHSLKVKDQKSKHTSNDSKPKHKRSESKSTASSASTRDGKRLSNDSNSGIHHTTIVTDPVSQLNQCCRDLKTSLIKGHENFVEAVELLKKIRSVPCRRYKLSCEVREAAQTTFQFFQSLQANATKEELSQAQALIASHHNRMHSAQETAVDSNSKIDTPTSTSYRQPLQNNGNSSILQNSTDCVVILSNSESAEKHTETNEQENFTADLEAKVDDVLSRIRATEERMAAAAAASNRPDTPYKSLCSQLTNFSARSTGGRIIRASAVAAATAHMHDEEDEESVMSRVEQVAAYEAATVEYPQLTNLGSPPPPPPPPPPLSLRPVSSSDQVDSKTSPNVDLDLDSRIQLFMSVTNSQKPVKPLKSKLAVKPCHPVTSPLPPSSPTSNDLEKTSLSSVTSTSIPLSTKKVLTSKLPSKDEELYDLLGNMFSLIYFVLDSNTTDLTYTYMYVILPFYWLLYTTTTTATTTTTTTFIIIIIIGSAFEQNDFFDPSLMLIDKNKANITLHLLYNEVIVCSYSCIYESLKMNQPQSYIVTAILRQSPLFVSSFSLKIDYFIVKMTTDWINIECINLSSFYQLNIQI